MAGYWPSSFFCSTLVLQAKRHLHLGFSISLKIQNATEAISQSSQNAYGMYKFLNFCNLMKRTGKNTE